MSSAFIFPFNIHLWVVGCAVAIAPTLSIGVTLQGLARLLTGLALATFVAFAGVVATIGAAAPQLKSLVLPGVG